MSFGISSALHRAALSVILWSACALVLTPGALLAQQGCLPSIQVTFYPDGLSVYVESDKDLSNVVLKFCDGSPDYKFDGLSGLTGTFSYLSKELAGVWVKSGCNQSGDGPGYGEFFGRTCGGRDPEPTPTPTPTVTPTTTPKVKICHIPPGNPAAAHTIEVDQSAVATHLAHGDILGECPVDCAGVPFGQAAIDQCGVCGGDNSVCKDCVGVPNGGAVIDICGVCNGNGTSCLGCDGVANSGKVYDQCGICGGDSSSCKDCNGVPNGGAQVDLCGVCNGQNNTCLDCLGVPNGTARPDACGICNGPNTDPNNCDPCDGTIDRCGVCNGQNSCLDCAGVPNGGAKIDCCGVCGGDGKSCLSTCGGCDRSGIRRVLLRNLVAVVNLIRTSSAKQLRCDPHGSAAVAARVALSNRLFQSAVFLVSDLFKKNVTLCGAAFCKATASDPLRLQLDQALSELYTLFLEAKAGASKGCGRVCKPKGKGSLCR